MIQINKTNSGEYTVYNFSSRGVDYEILTTDEKQFQVYTSVKSRSGTTPPKVFNSLAEMGNHSKTLKNFSILIAA